MARKLSFPIRMKKSNNIYTKKEFKSHFNLKKNDRVVFAMPILRDENTIQKNLQSNCNLESQHCLIQNSETIAPTQKLQLQMHKNHRVDSKVFIKPIARDEKSYIKNGYDRYVEKLLYIRYICNLKNFSSGSGSSSFFSSNSGSNMEFEFIICGYGLELI